jgi:alpha-glucosidase
MMRPWDPAALRAAIVSTLDAHRPVGAAATWVLSNHDVTRPVTRYGRADTSFGFAARRFGIPTDLALGRRRARAAALLTGALPGSLYVYQGDELGLPEVEDLPRDVLQDPMYFRSGGVDPGRDGCRVPLPWTAAGTSFGFGGAAPWLPQPAGWGRFSVAAQDGDPGSVLSLYRAMLALRRAEPGLRGESFAWLPTADEVLAFRRGDVLCAVNLGADPVALPAHTEVLLTSGDLTAGLLPTDTAAWLRA